MHAAFSIWALIVISPCGFQATEEPRSLAGPYQVGERLEALDAAWSATTDAGRRALAVSYLQHATHTFYSARYAEACSALDAATFALQGRDAPPEAALDVRCVPPAVAPRSSVRVEVTWAYVPNSLAPIAVGIGERLTRVQPGRNLTLTFDPARLGGDLSRDLEAGYAIPVRVGSLQRTAYVSFVKAVSRRVQDLRQAGVGSARDIGDALAQHLSRPGDIPFDLPVLDWLAAAESLASGRRTIANLDEVPFAKHKSALLRAAFPKTGETREVPGDVVMAFPGIAATENSFFDAYGRGAAVSEALRRGWGFVSVRTSENAAADAIEWLLEVRKAKVRRLFVLGHGIGAGVGLSVSATRVKPTAAAMVAPALTSYLKEWTEVPLFVSVGKQDISRVYAAAHTLARELGHRGDFLFREMDPCDHVLAMAESVRDVYTFFDRFAAAR